MIYTNVTLGADPEVFVANSKGKLISSVGKFGGTKDNPIPVETSYLGSPIKGAIQEDNVAVEFNIIPVKTRKEWVDQILGMLSYVEDKAAQNKLHTTNIAAAIFQEDQLQTPQAKVFGCEPDYDAWKVQENVMPVLTGEMKNLRTCGGHIHIGWDNPDMDSGINLVRALDVFLAVPYTLIEEKNLRRELYGRKGAFRPKPYGVEYRTLSNDWIFTQDKLNWVFEQTMKAIKFLNQGGKILESDEELIEKSIIEDDGVAQAQVLRKYPVLVGV